MVFLPVGIMGVVTSYSRKSLLSVEDIEREAIKNGIKYVGIVDKAQNFWIEDAYSKPRGVIKLFAAPERLLNLNNQSIRVYISPLSLEDLERISQLGFSLNYFDLRDINAIIFYSGNDKEHIKALRELFFTKLGIGITASNRNLAETLVDSIDFFIPFYHINAPRELKGFSFLKDTIKEEIHPFVHATNVLNFLDNTSKELQSKILYTEEHLSDVRELRGNVRASTNENYSSLLWNLVSSKIKVDEEVRKEFIHIKENGLSEFFYKLLLSVIEFSKHGYITSDLLSTSIIMRRMKLIKVNTSSKIIPLRFFIKDKPLYLDIYHSHNQEALEDILARNFGKEIFHRIYPVRLSSSSIEQIINGNGVKNSSTLVKYLKNVVTTYRISKNIYYSSEKILTQHYKMKNRISLTFCGGSYNVTIKFSKIRNYVGTNIYSESKIFDTINSDKSFITPHVAGVFWNSLRTNYRIRGFRDCLKFFHLAQILSTKPYLRHLVWEAIKENVPIFIEDILPPSLSDGVKKDLVEIIFLRDKSETILEEIDLFRLIMEEDISKDQAQKIVNDVKKYKPILGTESLEKQKFYEFLSLAYTKTKDIKKFLSHVLNDRILLTNRLKLSIILQSLSREFKILPPSINKNIRTFEISKKAIRLPLVVCNLKSSFLKEIVKERKKGEFADFYDFYRRIGKKDPKESNKLVKCGVFDETNDRKALLAISKFLSDEEVSRLVISDEIRIMGFSPFLINSGFSFLGLGSVDELLNGRTNRVFGFIIHIDKYGNFYLQDGTGTVYIRNKMYSFRRGQHGFFEIELGQSDALGTDFYCKYYSREI